MSHCQCRGGSSEGEDSKYEETTSTSGNRFFIGFEEKTERTTIEVKKRK